LSPVSAACGGRKGTIAAPFCGLPWGTGGGLGSAGLRFAEYGRGTVVFHHGGKQPRLISAVVPLQVMTLGALRAPRRPCAWACRPVSFHAADAVFLLWIHGEPFRNMFLTARKRAYIEEQRLRNVSGAFARLKRALDSTAPAACGKSTPDRLALLSGGSPLLGGGLGQMASNERLSNVVAIELSYAVGGGLFLSFLPQRRSPPFSQSFPASRSRELRRSAMTSTLRS
jgi:hypothetical protein